MSVQDRIDFVTFFEILRNRNWNVTFNEIAPRFEKWLPVGNNTSESFISFWKARLSSGKSDIAVKMFFDLAQKDGRFQRDAGFQSLVYESKVYQYITRKIIATKEAPNFIAYIGLFRVMPAIIKTVSNDSQRVDSYISSMANRLQVEKEYLDDMKFAGMVTQAPPNVVSLHQWYKTLIHNYPDYRDREEIYLPVLFQLIYALCVLDKHRIMHNDLHPFNILISTLDKEVKLKYQVNDKRYSIVTKHIVYIFDWGNAWIESIGNNPILGGFNCKALNMCNRFFQGYDMFIVLCNLHFDGVEELKTKHSILKEHDYNVKKVIEIHTKKGSFKGEPLLLNPEKYVEAKQFFQTHAVSSSNYGITVAMSKEDLREYLLPDYYEKVDDIESGVFVPVPSKGYIVAFGLFPCRLTFSSTIPLASPWEFFLRFSTFDRYISDLYPTWSVSQDEGDREQSIMFSSDFEDVFPSNNVVSSSNSSSFRDNYGANRSLSSLRELRTSTINDPD